MQIHKAIARLLRQKISADSTKNSAAYPQSGRKGEKPQKMHQGVGSRRAAPDSLEYI